MDESKLRKLAGLPVLAEGARPQKYHDSMDYDEDEREVEQHIRQALRILESSAWTDWMTATDANYDVKVKHISDELIAKLKDAQGTLNVLMHEIEKAA